MPPYLQASADAGGPAWATWLAALPARVEQLCARWQLVLDEPFEPGGNCSWVAPGTDADGRDVVLKVSWQHTEALHEAEGLAALGGRGAAELYASDHVADDTTALLLDGSSSLGVHGGPGMLGLAVVEGDAGHEAMIRPLPP